MQSGAASWRGELADDVRPSASRMLAWLMGPDVVAPDGSVCSWVNPQHPGYAYPEAAAWLLDLLARRLCCTAGGMPAVQLPATCKPRTVGDLRARIADRLVRQVTKDGGAGRDGTRYLFDSAIVLDALLSHAEAGGPLTNSSCLARLFDFVSETLGRRAGSDKPPGGPGRLPRWSDSYGCHLLRIAPVLLRYCRWRRGTEPQATCSRAERTAERVVARLLDDLLPLAERGRFITHHASRLCYTHSHCYAVEGLLGLCRLPPGAGVQTYVSHRRLRELVCECAQWLGDNQQAGGGLPAFHDGVCASGKPRADSTAQAVRLWAAVDRRRFSPHIAAAFGFLTCLQRACGGLCYSPSSGDVNTWATVFAADAVLSLEKFEEAGSGEL